MEIASHWRLRQQRYRLVGEVCNNCQGKIFPPRDVCPHCARESQSLYQFSGRGEIYSYTTVYDPPKDFEQQAPYTVALIKLEEGPLVTAQLTDIDRVYSAGMIGLVDVHGNKVDIGTKVEMVTRKLKEDGERGLIVYGYKFRPIDPSLASPE